MDATVYKNSAILIALRLVEPLFSLVVITAISRGMGPGALGSYSFLLTFSGFVSIFGQMGLSSLLTRDVAKRRDRASVFLNSAVFLGGCAALPMFVAMNCSGRFFHLTPEVSFCVLLISFSILPWLVTSAFEAIFMAFEKTELILYRRMVASVIRMLLVLLAVWMRAPLHYIVLIDLFNSLISVAVCANAFNKHIAKITFQIDWANVVELLKNCPTFFGLTVLTVLASRSDVLLLTRLASMNEVALYTVAMKLFEANTMLPQSYVRATFPRFSKLYHSGYEHFQPVAKRVFLHVTTYAVISACLMVTAGPLALRILFGEKFAGSFNVLRVLSLGIVPYSFGRVLSSALTAGDQQRFDLIAAIIATTVNLSLNALLIPHFGSTGSAIAFCSSLTVGCGAITVFTTRVLRKEFITSALGWGLGIGIGVICLFWLAMFHEIFALTAFLLVFTAAGSIFLAKHNRWQRIIAGSVSTYRSFMNP